VLKCEHYIGRPCISQSPFLAFVYSAIQRLILRGVDGSAVHAVMVGSEIIRRDSGTDNYQRVDGKPVHPTCVHYT